MGTVSYDVRAVQDPLWHKDVKTTITARWDTRVLNRGGKGAKSPVGDLQKSIAGVLCGNHT